MDFKFKKTDKVCINDAKIFTDVFKASDEHLERLGPFLDPFEITDRKMSTETLKMYKLKGLRGWWEESHLVLASEVKQCIQ